MEQPYGQSYETVLWDNYMRQCYRIILWTNSMTNPVGESYGTIVCDDPMGQSCGQERVHCNNVLPTVSDILSVWVNPLDVRDVFSRWMCIAAGFTRSKSLTACTVGVLNTLRSHRRHTYQ